MIYICKCGNRLQTALGKRHHVDGLFASLNDNLGAGPPLVGFVPFVTTLVIVAWCHPITFSARREQCILAQSCYSTPSLPLEHLDSLLKLQAAIRLDLETLALARLICGVARASREM